MASYTDVPMCEECDQAEAVIQLAGGRLLCKQCLIDGLEDVMDERVEAGEFVRTPDGKYRPNDSN